MQGFAELRELARYCENKYDECGALIRIDIWDVGLDITVTINKPKVQILQLKNIFSWEQVEGIPLNIFKECIDMMVREIHLQYVKV